MNKTLLSSKNNFCVIFDDVWITSLSFFYFLVAMDRKEYLKKYRLENKGRNKRVTLTFSTAEYRAFVRASNGGKLAPFIKAHALASLEQHALIPDDIKEELTTLRFAIRNIANNVNQIAHHSNLVRGITSEGEHSLLAHIKQLEEAVVAYTEGRLTEQTDNPDDN